MPPESPLYLEDLEVGFALTTQSHEMTEEEIVTFARQFDPQPFHLDKKAAKDTLFRGLAASGWHTASVSMRLMVEHGLPIAGGLVGAGVELSWPQPTRAGDVLRVITEVVEVTPSQSKPDRGIVTVRSTTLNQNDEVLQIMTSKMLAWSRESGRA